MASGKEGRIGAEIRQCVLWLGGWIQRVQSGEIHGTDFRGNPLHVMLADKGTPDYIACFPGALTIWIETKTSKGQLSPEQVETHAALRAMGHNVIVARSQDALLEALGYDPPFVVAPGRWQEENEVAVERTTSGLTVGRPLPQPTVTAQPRPTRRAPGKPPRNLASALKQAQHTRKRKPQPA